MTVDEYLSTSFDDADCEYLDREVVERNAGELPHADALGTTCRLLAALRPSLGIRVVPVTRIRVQEITGQPPFE
jgi:hypothetical protein